MRLLLTTSTAAAWLTRCTWTLWRPVQPGKHLQGFIAFEWIGQAVQHQEHDEAPVRVERDQALGRDPGSAVAALSRMYAWGRKVGLIDCHNPVAGSERPSVEQSLEFLSRDEVTTLRRTGSPYKVLVVPGHAGLQNTALHRDRPHAAVPVDEGVLQLRGDDEPLRRRDGPPSLLGRLVPA